MGKSLSLGNPHTPAFDDVHHNLMGLRFSPPSPFPHFSPTPTSAGTQEKLVTEIRVPLWEGQFRLEVLI
jgi:hypothetical protein